MLLTFLLAAALWNCNCWWNAANIYTFAVQPGYLDFDNLPDTNFSCDGKVIGGYYADVETGCQMFHVCTIGQKAEITDIKFLCLNGTVFDQETRVCERLDEVDCSKSESFFDLNLELYGNNGAGYGIAPEEPPEQDTVRCDEEEEDCSGTSDYFEEEPTTVAAVRPVTATVSTTTSTTTMTPVTTVRTIVQPTIATTSTRKPPAAVMPSSTARPPAVSYPTNSPETIAALIALHNAFQESLKEREQSGPGPKGQQAHRYQPPLQQQQQQQQQPKPFTVTNFQPPRHFPSKPSSTPPPYRHQDSAHPVLLSSERFGNQNFRHGFRLQNGPQSYQQQQYDGSSYDEDADDEESRRNFAREAPESSVSVSVQVSSSSSKNSAIEQQQDQKQKKQQEQEQDRERDEQQEQQEQRQQQQQQQRQQDQQQRQQEQQQRQQEQRQRQQEQQQRLEEQQEQQRQHATTMATATTQKPPPPQPSTQEPPPSPPPADDVESGDLYEDEYEELEGDEEFFKDVPKLGRNKRRRRSVSGRLWRA